VPDVRARALIPAAARSFPDAELTAQRDDLADMIRGVVGDEQDFAQIGLSRAVRNRLKEIDAGIRRKPLQRLQVAVVAGDRPGPGVGVARRRRYDRW